MVDAAITAQCLLADYDMSVDSANLAELRSDIARRLRPVYANCTEAEFEALVDRMARVQAAYEQRAANEWADRTARPVERSSRESRDASRRGFGDPPRF